MPIILQQPDVWFVDTSILVNILRVPKRDQDCEKVLAELKRKMNSNDTLILPIATVVETGNHIAQVHDGRLRRSLADQFSQLLILVAHDRAPWRLNELVWSREFLEILVAQPAPGNSLINLAVSGVGCGDACILAEREMYRQRSSIKNVYIWSLDDGLLAHN